MKNRAHNTYKIAADRGNCICLRSCQNQTNSSWDSSRNAIATENIINAPTTVGSINQLDPDVFDVRQAQGLTSAVET